MKLKYVTITGADDKTSHEAMIEISKKYPFVEWGILFSNSRQGEPRFPSLDWIEELKRKVEEAKEKGVKLNFSAHLCGQYTREIIEKGTNELVKDNLKDVGGIFQRVQLNFNANNADVHPGFYDFIKNYGDDINFILQNNKANAVVIQEVLNREIKADVLWDGSGGRGTEIKDWFPPFYKRFTGYAGGLNPDNIAEKLHKFFGAEENIGFLYADDKEYKPDFIWIDTESGARSETRTYSNGEPLGEGKEISILDLEKVEKFLEIASKYAGPYPKRYDFSKEDRYVIAEFVYSEQTDILIVSDCTKLVEVLAKHNIITDAGKEEWLEHIKNKAPGIVGAIRKVLTENVSAEQGKEIMNEYYGK